jgi:hypothetical protein
MVEVAIGQIGSGLDLGPRRLAQFDILEEIGSDQGQINLYVVFFQIFNRFRLD